MLAFLRDLAILLAAYGLGYLARFPGAELATMAPGALRWAPALVLAQLAGVELGRRQGNSRVPIIAGLAAGTIVGHLLSFAWVQNLESVSRAAFVLDFVLALPIVWLGSPRPAAPERHENDLVDAAAADAGMWASLEALVRFRELIRNLVSKDLKLKYRGSLFGFLWSLMNPLIMMSIYVIAFTKIMQVRTEGFVFLVLLGIVAWTFFSTSASMGAGAIVDNGGLLKTVHFPRAVLPISTVLFSLAQFLLTISVFLPCLLLFYSRPPRAVMLLFPLVVTLQVAMTIGITLTLAAGTAFFRDIRHLLDIALSMMFWTTPIIYNYETIKMPWRSLVLLSPMSPFVLSYQQIFYYGRVPDPEVCAVAVLYATVAFFGGFALFTRVQHEFVEQI